MSEVFTFLLTLVVFIFFIGLFIIAHELGHYFFAKKAGILVHEFAIGMGPVIYKKKRGETVFSIRALPIGGYVQMASDLNLMEYLKKGNKLGLNLEEGAVSQIIVNNNMDADKTGYIVDFDLCGKDNGNLYIRLKSEDKITEYPVLNNAHYVFNESSQLQISPYDRTFDSKKITPRALTLVAGTIMNFIAAFFIYIIFWAIMGVPNQSSNIIGNVIDNNPATSVLEIGDEITHINGRLVETWSEGSNSVSAILAYLAQQNTETVTFTLNRVGYSEPIERAMYNNIVLNSIGVSNLGVKADQRIGTDELGIRVGVILHNHVGNPSSNERLMRSGDILTGIRIYNRQGNNFVGPNNPHEWQDIYSWSELMSIVRNIDVVRIRYRFIPVDNNGNLGTQIVSATQIESFGVELLNNQRVSNIIISVGISPQTHFSVFGIVTSSINSFVSDFTLIFRTLQILIAPSGFRQVGLSDLSGPVGIFRLIGNMMQHGILPLLSFVAMLSVNFGIINLLPIPVFDGGRLVFLGYEAVTKKKPNKKVEAFLTTLVFFLLMLLMIYVTFNDIFG